MGKQPGWLPQERASHRKRATELPLMTASPGGDRLTQRGGHIVLSPALTVFPLPIGRVSGRRSEQLLVFPPLPMHVKERRKKKPKKTKPQLLQRMWEVEKHPTASARNYIPRGSDVGTALGRRQEHPPAQPHLTRAPRHFAFLANSKTS